MNFVTAFHYSNKSLIIGDIISSNQHKAKTYQIFWPIYNRVCQEILNKDFFKEFGYAYPIENNQFNLNINKYLVKGDNVITGNFKYSIYLMMECLDTSWKQENTLSERLKAREDLIRLNAIKYFTEISDIHQCELISPYWEIIEKISK